MWVSTPSFIRRVDIPAYCSSHVYWIYVRVLLFFVSLIFTFKKIHGTFTSACLFSDFISASPKRDHLRKKSTRLISIQAILIKRLARRKVALPVLQHNLRGMYLHYSNRRWWCYSQIGCPASSAFSLCFEWAQNKKCSDLEQPTFSLTSDWTGFGWVMNNLSKICNFQRREVQSARKGYLTTNLNV